MDRGLLDAILRSFTGTITSQWGPVLHVYMTRVLLMIMGAQFLLVTANLALNHVGLHNVMRDFTLGAIRVLIPYELMKYIFVWGNDIYSFGIGVGDVVSGFTPDTITPSGILNLGLHMVGVILHSKSRAGWLFAGPIQDLWFLIIAIGVTVCWLGAALILLGTILEAYMTVFGGPIIIAFSPLSWTGDMLIKWLVRMLDVAIKIAVVIMTLAISIALMDAWMASLAATSSTLTTNFWNLVVTAAESIVMLYCVWHAPKWFVTLVGGSPTWSFGEAALAMISSNLVSGGARSISRHVSSAAGGLANQADLSLNSTGISGAVRSALTTP